MPALQPFAAAYYNPARLPDAVTRLDDPDRWSRAVRTRSGPDVPGEAAGAPPYHVALLYRDWAGTQLSQWLSQGILASDAEPTLYVYRQRRPIPSSHRTDPRTPEGAAVTGLLAAVDVGGASPVRLAEAVDPAEVEALATAMKAFAYDLAPAWGLYGHDAPGGKEATALLQAVVQEPPHLEFSAPEGIVHQLWRLDAPTREKAKQLFEPLPVAVVLGGAQVAALRAQNGRTAEERASRLLMLLSPTQGADLAPAVLPVHRLLLRGAGLTEEALVGRISRFFRLLEPSPPEAVAASLAAPPKAAAAAAGKARAAAAADVSLASAPTAADTANAGDGQAPAAPRLTPLQAALVEVGNLHTEFNGFVMYTAGRRIRLVRSKGRMFMENWTHPLGRAAWRSMDVNILHALLFERALGIPVPTSRLSRPPIALEPDVERAVQRVEEGEAVAAFLLPAPSLGQLFQAAMDNNPIPAGAVRLWPPPAAGILFRRRR